MVSVKYAAIGDSVVLADPDRAAQCTAFLAKKFKEFGVTCRDTTTSKSGSSGSSVYSSDYVMV